MQRCISTPDTVFIVIKFLTPYGDAKRCHRMKTIPVVALRLVVVNPGHAMSREYLKGLQAVAR